MQLHRTTATALALLIALTAVPGLAAARDDDENGHHDNGKHKGWYKHHRDEDEGNGQRSGARNLSGRIVSINGNALGVQLNNGQTVYVNDGPAVNSGRTPNLYVGEYVRISGGTANDGTLYANTIAQTGGPNNGTYNNGAYNNGYGYGPLTNIVGYEISAVDGNGNFQLRAGNSPVAVLGGTTYTVHVDGNTRVDTGLGSVGQRVHVIGRLNGNTILATQITS